MAITKRSEEWKSSSVPTANDFNRIEKNIETLDNTKEPVINKLPISRGGTGATTASGARNNLGLGNTDGALPIENGGTGATSVASARNALGLGNTGGALPVANGGTGATTVPGARSALGLGYTSGPLPIENGGTGATSVASALGFLGLGYTSGPLPIANGGTGATSVAGARNNLGLGNTGGPLPIANGGTGAYTIATARKALGLGETEGPVPVNCGGTGKTFFSNGYLIVGNGVGSLTELSPGNVKVGYSSNADKAACDGNGNDISGTYLGTSTTVLLGPDYEIGGDGKSLSIKGNFSDFKYIIFLARDEKTGSNADYTYCMV